MTDYDDYADELSETNELSRHALIVSGLLKGYDPPTVEEIGRVLSLQGAILNGIGMQMLEEASSLDGSRRSKRLAEGVKLISQARNCLVDSARILAAYEGPPAELTAARERLVQMAIDSGFELAFESDGRLVLENVRRDGSRYPVQDV